MMIFKEFMMQRRRLLGTLCVSALGTLALQGCMTDGETRSARAASSGRQCFNARMVSGFTPVDRDTVDVRIGPRRGFRLALTGYCRDINWAQSVALRSRTGSFICGPLDAELIVPSLIGPQRCIVTGMRELTQAELRGPRRRR
jgi:hypothetical protein